VTGDPSDRRSDEHARWRQVLEVAPEAYLAIDDGSRIADWNRRAEALFGWSQEEVRGRPVSLLVAPSSPTGFPEGLASCSPEELAEPFDLLGVRRDGHVLDVQCTVWGVDRRAGGVAHVFLQDVTERRRAQQAAALLTAVVESSSDAMITRDLDGVIVSWNAGAERIYGWSAEEAVGQPDSLIVPPDRAAEWADMMSVLRRGGRVSGVETERLSRGGTRVPVALTLSPVHDAQGRMVATSAIGRDVTEQRWMAETLDATLQQLHAAADEARESEAASRRFLADAAHQLRTPVAGIRACAETLLLGSSAADADRLLAMLVRESTRAGNLISDLLRIARLDQGVPLSVAPVDVVRLCADEVERLSLLRPEVVVRLEVRQPPPATVTLDRAALREVLSNLGDNAVRHADRSVGFDLDVTADELRLSVRDDGGGVPEPSREEVFERFVSLDGQGGSGLGLPIARALARAMGGELRCDGGFVLTLPVAGAASRPAAGR
jgi:PAS domain S-box-containing protein